MKGALFFKTIRFQTYKNERHPDHLNIFLSFPPRLKIHHGAAFLWVAAALLPAASPALLCQEYSNELNGAQNKVGLPTRNTTRVVLQRLQGGKGERGGSHCFQIRPPLHSSTGEC